jgi:hypothetical protein
MYYTVYNGTSIFDGYALVIAANSGFTAATDSWYQDGLIATSTVHLVFGDGWTPANMGITNSDWTTCCSDLPTLAQLDSVVIPGMGGEDWGGLSIYKARVAIGDSGSGTPGYTADISSVELNPPVVTPEGGSGNLYLLLAGMACFAAMFLGRRWGSVSAPAN